VFRAQLEDARARLGPSALLWAGVGAWRLGVEGVVEKIRVAREAGASGVVLFSHESFLPADLDELHADAFVAVAAPQPAGAGGLARRRPR